VPKRNSAFLSARLAISFLLLISSTVGAACGQSQMSWEQLNKELAQRPNDANLWCMRGEILAKTFEDKEAIDCYTKAIELNPSLARAYIFRGNAYLSYEKTGDALNDYLKAQTFFKGKADAKGYFDTQLALAKCYKILKQYSLELPIRKDVLKSQRSLCFISERNQKESSSNRLASTVRRVFCDDR
jgi:tetratricopeptide (TPR) repeat protein